MEKDDGSVTGQFLSGTRAIAVWPLRWSERPSAPCFYLHGVGDPGNVGTIIRTLDALVGGSVVLGPDTADPFAQDQAQCLGEGRVVLLSPDQPVPNGSRMH